MTLKPPMSPPSDTPPLDNVWDDFPDHTRMLTDHPHTEARLRAVQALYQIHFAQQDEASVLRQLIAQAEAVGTNALLSQIIQGVGADHARFQAMLEPRLKTGWTWARLHPVQRFIFLAAAYELAQQPATPVGVVVSEYVVITRALVGEAEAGFVNGLLDNLAKMVRPEEGRTPLPVAPKPAV